MSVTPPTISPRLRSREPIATKPAAASAAVSSTPPLRVLIRLPNLAAPKSSAARFPFAATLFSTLKRKYAAAAFAVFVVVMGAMLIHGRHKPTASDDGGTEAPRWNSSVTTLPKSGAAAPVVQSTSARLGTGNASAWPPAQQTPTDAQRGAAPYANSWQQPSGVAPAGSAAMNRSTADAIPNMPLHNPSANAMSDRAPPWQSEQTTPTSDTRIARRDEIVSPPPSNGPANFEQTGVPHLDGTIRPPEQPNGYPQGTQYNR